MKTYDCLKNFPDNYLIGLYDEFIKFQNNGSFDCLKEVRKLRFFDDNYSHLHFFDDSHGHLIEKMLYQEMARRFVEMKRNEK